MRGGGEFADDAVDGVFGGIWADDNKVGAGFLDLGGDEAIDATGEREDEYDGSNADGDADGGEERARAIEAEAGGG